MDIARASLVWCLDQFWAFLRLSVLDAAELGAARLRCSGYGHHGRTNLLVRVLDELLHGRSGRRQCRLHCVRNFAAVGAASKAKRDRGGVTWSCVAGEHTTVRESGDEYGRSSCASVLANSTEAGFAGTRRLALFDSVNFGLWTGAVVDRLLQLPNHGPSFRHAVPTIFSTVFDRATMDHYARTKAASL